MSDETPEGQPAPAPSAAELADALAAAERLYYVALRTPEAAPDLGRLKADADAARSALRDKTKGADER